MKSSLAGAEIQQNELFPIYEVEINVVNTNNFELTDDYIRA